MINTQPPVCNLCGGEVILCSNARVYHGREYGSGLCCYCLGCGAYAGTHKPRPQEAMGLLGSVHIRASTIRAIWTKAKKMTSSLS